MKRYEYKIEKADMGETIPQVESRLNSYGADGWTAIHVFTSEFGVTIWLMREIPDQI